MFGWRLVTSAIYTFAVINLTLHLDSGRPGRERLQFRQNGLSYLNVRVDVIENTNVTFESSRLIAKVRLSNRKPLHDYLLILIVLQSKH